MPSPDPTWTAFLAGFYDRELALETRALGDIEFHADQPDGTEFPFDFTLDEIKHRHAIFLNFTVTGEEGAEPEDGGPAHSPPLEVPAGLRRGSVERSPEAVLKKDIEDNMDHELKDLEGESIKSAFVDFNYWKPEIDHNIDDLMSELALNKS